jgi:hypothetical protein
MRRLVCVLCASLVLLTVPSVALASTKSATAFTYYSNVNGWNFTLVDTYSASTSTQWKITGVSLRAHLTADPTVLLGFGFKNVSGTIGPMYVRVYSGSSTAYANQCSVTHTLSPGSTSTHTWAPNVLTKVNSTYGNATVYWTQKLNWAPKPECSSRNPATMATVTY